MSSRPLSVSSSLWDAFVSGVRRVYGLPGDSLNGFTDALRRSGERRVPIQ